MPTLRLTTVSNVAATIRAEVRTKDMASRVPMTILSGTGVEELLSSPSIELPVFSEVLDALVEVSVLAVARGQVYATLGLFEGELKQVVCRGYVYDGKPLMEGENVEPGPAGGHGHLHWAQVFHNRAGNAAALDYDLFATNILRKVYGLVWYYHATGVATRTFTRPQLLGLGGTKPTGFTLTGNSALFWEAGSNITLTDGEEGTFAYYSTEGKDGRAVAVDNGVLTEVNAAAVSTPWPLWVTEDDTDTILRFPAITNGLAADTHSAYVLMEEWLVP